MKLTHLFRAAVVAPHRLRMEIFALGDRYQGDALAGARRELREPRLSSERRDLLRAVVAHLTKGSAAGGEKEPSRPPARFAAAAYAGVFAAAVAWTVMIARSLSS